MPRLFSRAAVASLAVAVVSTLAVESSAQAGSVVPTVAVTSGCSLPVSADWTSRLADATKPARIIVGPADEAAARKVATTTSMWRLADKQLRMADAVLTTARPKYDGSNMDSFIKQGRTAVTNAASLLYGSTITSNAKYLQRVKQDALDFASFPNWGPSHFLGVSELAAAVALEYSLTSQLMSAGERATVKAALVTKALAPASCLWETNNWQVTATHNWGVITNAGMILAALIIEEDNRDLSAAVIARALPLYNRGLDQAKDGGSPEGPAYADYIAKFAAYVTSSVSMTLGSSNLQYFTGVPQSAQYWNAIAGAKGKAFNYGDSNLDRFTPLLPILNARLGGDIEGKELAKMSIDNGDTNTLLLLWYAQTDMIAPVSGSIAKTFPVSGFTTLRSTVSPAKTWLSIRGGSNSANHAHLDLGGFVLEMQGTRFVSDLGGDNYSLPYYFGKLRNDYARIQSTNHSTVTNTYQNQPVTASALTSAITNTGDQVSVSLDMAQALAARTASRDFSIDAQGGVLVRDVAEFATARQLNWGVITTAQITLSDDNTTATLTLEGKTITVKSYSAGSVFKVSSVPSSPSPGYSNASFKKLEIVKPTVFVATDRYRAEVIVGFKS